MEIIFVLTQNKHTISIFEAQLRDLAKYIEADSKNTNAYKKNVYNRKEGNYYTQIHYVWCISSHNYTLSLHSTHIFIYQNDLIKWWVKCTPPLVFSTTTSTKDNMMCPERKIKWFTRNKQFCGSQVILIAEWMSSLSKQHRYCRTWWRSVVINHSTLNDASARLYNFTIVHAFAHAKIFNVRNEVRIHHAHSYVHIFYIKLIFY